MCCPKSAPAHQTPGIRINNLESAQIKILTRARQQRLQVFDMRGDNELIAPVLEQIQHLPARSFNARRFGRQYFFDAIWQQPAVYRCHYAIPL